MGRVEIKDAIGGLKLYIDQIEQPHINIIDKGCRIGDKLIYKPIVDLIKGLQLNDFTNRLKRLSFIERKRLFDYDVYIQFFFNEKKKYDREETTFVLISFSIDFKNWKNFYTGRQFFLAIEKFALEIPEIEVHDFRDNDDPIGIYLFFDDSTQSIESVTNQAVEVLLDLYNKAINYLTHNDANETMISRVFEFPEEIKSPCMQYLMYFSQFLLDIGIEANTSISEEANRILFTVVPETKEIAIEKIGKALEVFLQAPSIHEMKDENEIKDIALLQWQSNIYRLKSDLLLSQSIIQSKNATIEALNISNYQLKSIVANFEKDQNSKNSEEENIISNIVSVKKFEIFKAFSINLAEIVRRLKRK